MRLGSGVSRPLRVAAVSNVNVSSGGIWSRLGVDARAEQLDRMIELTGELYPTFRWFLYDGAVRYAGAERAAVGRIVEPASRSPASEGEYTPSK